MTPELKYYALGFLSHYVFDIVVGVFLFWIGWRSNRVYHESGHKCMVVLLRDKGTPRFVTIAKRIWRTTLARFKKKEKDRHGYSTD